MGRACRHSVVYRERSDIGIIPGNVALVNSHHIEPIPYASKSSSWTGMILICSTERIGRNGTNTLLRENPHSAHSQASSVSERTSQQFGHWDSISSLLHLYGERVDDTFLLSRRSHVAEQFFRDDLPRAGNGYRRGQDDVHPEEPDNESIAHITSYGKGRSYRHHLRNNVGKGYRNTVEYVHHRKRVLFRVPCHLALGRTHPLSPGYATPRRVEFLSALDARLRRDVRHFRTDCCGFHFDSPCEKNRERRNRFLRRPVPNTSFRPSSSWT